MDTIPNHFSIIDHDLTVEGTIFCKGKLVVKGTVRGRIEGGTIIIAEEGAVYAETKVTRMTVSGRFEGNVEASDQLVVLSTGTCLGKIACKNLVVEANAQLKADVVCIALRDTVAEEGRRKET